MTYLLKDTDHTCNDRRMHYVDEAITCAAAGSPCRRTTTVPHVARRPAPMAEETPMEGTVMAGV